MEKYPYKRNEVSPSNRPLLRKNAPSANNLEIDEDTDDNRENVDKPYPGVDDGFFIDNNNSNDSENNKPKDGFDGRGTEEDEVELISSGKNPAKIPELSPRLGPDGGNTNNPDEDPEKIPPETEHPEFPISPGFRPFGWDLEIGNTLPSGETIPDLNVYQHKKTLAQGMMDLALFSANANQLRYVLETFKNHPYYYPSFVLISISLILQVAVGIGLIWNASYNIKDQKALCIANRVNNATTICVFLITVINVFISAFGVAPMPS